MHTTFPVMTLAQVKQVLGRGDDSSPPPLDYAWSKMPGQDRVKLEFGVKAKSNMQNSMAMFTFSVVDPKCTLCSDFVQENKVSSLS